MLGIGNQDEGGNDIAQNSEMGIEDLDINIENVVATAFLDQKLALPAIIRSFKNTEFSPKKFPGLVFRLRRPKSTTLLFRTRKMVCTGTKTAKQARSALRKVDRELKKGGIIICIGPP